MLKGVTHVFVVTGSVTNLYLPCAEVMLLDTALDAEIVKFI
jgi:hypothetical protein